MNSARVNKPLQVEKLPVYTIDTEGRSLTLITDLLGSQRLHSSPCNHAFFLNNTGNLGFRNAQFVLYSCRLLPRLLY